jgi:peptidoglycan/LPS O-acetylase OafA/YrhL
LAQAKHREIVWFNAVRGIAALEVCVSHLRSFVFVNFAAVARPTVLDRLFYFATGLGHEAVVIFFVMSGWLVGGSVWRQQREGRFSWRDYATARLTRLWLVLIPALIWTEAVDHLGISMAGGDGYDGSRFDMSSSGPGNGEPLDLSMTAFAGNALFLQTILVPVLGTNGPLWSLAYEFWYYAAFPLLAFAWHRRGSWRGLGFAAAGAAILAWLPAPIEVGFVIWLLGWLGALTFSRIRASAALPLTLASVVLTIALLVVFKQRTIAGSGIFLGVAVAGLLIGLRLRPNSAALPRAQAAASHLAKISYTLYLFHFPLLALCFFSLHLTQRQPGTAAYGEFALLLGAVLIVVTGLWYLFERRTESVRQWVRSLWAPH